MSARAPPGVRAARAALALGVALALHGAVCRACSCTDTAVCTSVRATSATVSRKQDFAALAEHDAIDGDMLVSMSGADVAALLAFGFPKLKCITGTCRGS